VPLLDEDYLILSTIHSAKGQEWKSVYLLNVVDGCMPSDLGAGTSAEIEEERSLLYVAMTRAKDDLHLVVPQRFFVHGQHAQGDRPKARSGLLVREVRGRAGNETKRPVRADADRSQFLEMR
jgi:superfamily I DNA/RNA helicase